MSGPAKTPTAVLKARGSWRANGRKGEMAGLVCLPKCPDFVTDIEARQLYKRLGVKLTSAGVMTNFDSISLGMLANTFAMYLTAKRIIDTEGALTMSATGTTMAHPAVNIMNQSFDRLHKMCREFGLTPSARSAIQVGSSSGETTSKVDTSRFFKVG